MEPDCWIKLEGGRLDVGIFALDGDPEEHAARFLEALGPDYGEVHIEVIVAGPAAPAECVGPLPPPAKGTLTLRITDAFVCRPDCHRCLGSGHVCEEHPDKPWDEGDGCCGAAGMPCNPDLRGGPNPG